MRSRKLNNLKKTLNMKKVFLVGFALSVFACKKSHEPTDIITSSKLAYIMYGTKYKLTAAFDNEGLSILETKVACLADDTFMIFPNGGYIDLRKGGIECDTNLYGNSASIFRVDTLKGGIVSGISFQVFYLYPQPFGTTHTYQFWLDSIRHPGQNLFYLNPETGELKLKIKGYDKGSFETLYYNVIQ
jgi:hypothetical protein